MQQIYSRPKSKTKKTSHKKRVIPKKIIQKAGDGENGQPAPEQPPPIEEQAPPMEEQPPVEEQAPTEEQAAPTENKVIDNSASVENLGNGIGLNQNTNNQRTGFYTKEAKAEKTGIEKKLNSLRSGLSFHVPSSQQEVNRGKNEVMASLTGQKIPGFLPSTSSISSDIIPKFFYHDFYPQTSISYQLDLPEPDQEKFENQNQNQPNETNA